MSNPTIFLYHTLDTMQSGAEPLMSEDFFKGQEDPEKIAWLVKERNEYNWSDTPKYFCGCCGRPLNISGGGDTGLRQYHFRHRDKNIDCEFQEEGKVWTEDEINRIKFNGRQEGKEHKFLKAEISRFLSLEYGVEAVGVEQRITFDKKWRKPDVCLHADGLNVAFEVQLATINQQVIKARNNTYRDNGWYILWIFDSFHTIEEASFTQRDAGDMNKGNYFILDEDALSKSQDEGKLWLHVYYYVYEFDGEKISYQVKDEFVPFDGLMRDEGNHILYYVDSSASELNAKEMKAEADSERKREEAKERAEREKKEAEEKAEIIRKQQLRDRYDRAWEIFDRWLDMPLFSDGYEDDYKVMEAMAFLSNHSGDWFTSYSAKYHMEDYDYGTYFKLLNFRFLLDSMERTYGYGLRPVKGRRAEIDTEIQNRAPRELKRLGAKAWEHCLPYVPGDWFLDMRFVQSLIYNGYELSVESYQNLCEAINNQIMKREQLDRPAKENLLWMVNLKIEFDIESGEIYGKTLSPQTQQTLKTLLKRHSEFLAIILSHYYSYNFTNFNSWSSLAQFVMNVKDSHGDKSEERETNLKFFWGFINRQKRNINYASKKHPRVMEEMQKRVDSIPESTNNHIRLLVNAMLIGMHEPEGIK